MGGGERPRCRQRGSIRRAIVLQGCVRAARSTATRSSPWGMRSCRYVQSIGETGWATMHGVYDMRDLHCRHRYRAHHGAAREGAPPLRPCSTPPLPEDDDGEEGEHMAADVPTTRACFDVLHVCREKRKRSMGGGHDVVGKRSDVGRRERRAVRREEGGSVGREQHR